MKTERWPDLERIVGEALWLSPGRRDAFVAAACGDDAELLAEVRALLSADRRAGGFLVSPAGASGDPQPPPAAGDRLGPYRLLEAIGEGGMSVIFLASRDDEQYRHRVAVKVLDPFVSARARDRFRTECQILANLEHPAIARLLDAGLTPDGRGYLVIEHVDGQRVDAYYQAYRLGLRARLELFLEICSAVEHAHRNLVVHRDLKPSNVLVTADGLPKLLDFGIARLLGAEEAASGGEATVTCLRPLTPAYASPEQFGGGRVTTAMDVYSLGVLLHLLLTDQLPAARGGEPWTQVARRDPDARAAPPSTRVDAGSDPAARAWKRRLAGDLDAIVLEALAPRPKERYPSAERLGDDLRRHLAGQPVAARQGGLWYRAGKFCRRRRWPLAVGAAFLLLAIGFGAVLARQAYRTARERDKAEQTAEFLIELFRVSNPNEGVAATVPARELIDRGAERIARESRDPEVRASLQETVGLVYQNLGLNREAADLLRVAHAARRELYGKDDPRTLGTLFELACAIYNGGDRRGIDLLETVLSERRRTLGPRHPSVAETLRALGVARLSEGELVVAESLVGDAVDIYREAVEPPHPALVSALTTLAFIVGGNGDAARAEALHREALAQGRILFGEGDPRLAQNLEGLATILHGRDQLDEAVSLLEELLDLQRRLLGGENPVVESLRNSYGRALQDSGRLAEAEAQFRRNIAAKRRRLGDLDPDLATALNNTGVVVALRGDLDTAESLLREALAIRRTSLGEQHPYVGQSLFTLGRLLHLRGDLAGAEELMAAAVDNAWETLPDGHPAAGYAELGLAQLWLDTGRPADAEPLARSALEKIRGSHPPGQWRVAWAESALAACLLAQGRGGTADLAAAADRLAAARGPESQEAAWAQRWLAAAAPPPSPTR